MSEQLSTNAEQGSEFDSLAKMHEIITNFLPEDAEFLAEFDEEDLLGTLYGLLNDIGEDPDEIFAEYSIVEPGDGEMNGNSTD